MNDNHIADERKKVGPAEPIYQVTAEDSDWMDACKEVYEKWPEHARRIVYAAPIAPRADADTAGASDAERFLTENDMAALFMFVSQCEDSDADGYTARKETMTRLAEIGCVESKGFGRYAPTMFGLWLIESAFEQNPSLPLLTRADYNAKSAKESGK